MHSSRMRTTRSSSPGGGAWPVPPNFPLGCGAGPDHPQLPPWLWRPPPHDQAPPGPGTPLGPDPHPLWTEFLTHASENVTFPQTSFAGGNKYILIIINDHTDDKLLQVKFWYRLS